MTNIVALSARRVADHTAPAINARIRAATLDNLRRAAAGGREAIDRRLAELDREWDIERCLETGASSLVLTGTLLGLTADRRWFALPLGVAGFLLQHAIQGWCPPMAAFRRLGVRTAEEIALERHALKALRGDFAGIDPTSMPEAAAGAAELK